MSRKFGLKAIKLAALLVAAPMLVLATGCSEECLDKYDCAPKATVQADGGFDLWTCSANKCVKGTPTSSDTGSDAGP